MSLTEAGAIYLAEVEAGLRALERARDLAASVASGPAGTLRLTASVAFGTTCVVPELPAFRAAFPNVEIELLLSDANLDLVAERIDLAIRLAPILQADVVTTKLVDTRYHVCAARAYISAQGGLDGPEALSTRDCLLFALPGYRSHWLFRNAEGAVTKVAVRGSLAMSNALALRAATLLGLGPALLPDWLIAGDLASGALLDLFPDQQAAATNFETAAWLLYPSRVYLPAKVRVMIDFLKGRLAR